MRAMRLGLGASLGAVLGVVVWLATYIFSVAQYPEGTEIPTWIDALLTAGLLIFVVSVLVIFGSVLVLVGSAVSTLLSRPRS